MGAGVEDDRQQLEERFVRYVVSPELKRAFGPPADDRPDGKRAAVARHDDGRIQVIIEANLDYPGGAEKACDRIRDLIRRTLFAYDGPQKWPVRASRYFVFTRLSENEVSILVQEDQEGPLPSIFKIWPDHELEAYLDRSVRLIKADACHRTFEAYGEGVVWAVVDSGIDEDHVHFQRYANLDLDETGRTAREKLRHKDFTAAEPESPLTDVYGHGTHVAGILGGASPDDDRPRKVIKSRGADGIVRTTLAGLEKPITGVAPRVKIVSLKVLDDAGKGQESGLIQALEHVIEVNGDRDRLRIHGVNISLGYPFLEPEWFATGHSPICRQVNRLVDRGVVVVVAAGNDGSANIRTEGALRRVGLGQTIADPGNAEKAITVGSTHAEEPLRYGVSYFSSKGPTADGRLKPDILAPGERILSCASPASLSRLLEAADMSEAGHEFSSHAGYRQDTGTSMAAPHVSGAIAAFISVRTELKGEPQLIKEALMDSASDLGRQREFQGAGLIDLMRAMQIQINRRKTSP